MGIDDSRVKPPTFAGASLFPSIPGGRIVATRKILVSIIDVLVGGQHKMYHSPDQHKATCYCGRLAKKHIAYGTGCGNVCGIHARKIARIKGNACKVGQLVMAVQQ